MGGPLEFSAGESALLLAIFASVVFTATFPIAMITAVWTGVRARKRGDTVWWRATGAYIGAVVTQIVVVSWWLHLQYG